MSWLNWPLLDKGYSGKWPTTPKEQKNCSKLPRKNFALAKSLARFSHQIKWKRAMNQLLAWNFNSMQKLPSPWRPKLPHPDSDDSSQKHPKDIDKDFSKMELESPKIYELSHHSRQHHKGKNKSLVQQDKQWTKCPKPLKNTHAQDNIRHGMKINWHT